MEGRETEDSGKGGLSNGAKAHGKKQDLLQKTETPLPNFVTINLDIGFLLHVFPTFFTCN